MLPRTQSNDFSLSYISRLCLCYVFIGVCLSVHGGGVSLTEAPPYGNERAVPILLECILVKEYCYLNTCCTFLVPAK